MIAVCLSPLSLCTSEVCHISDTEATHPFHSFIAMANVKCSSRLAIGTHSTFELPCMLLYGSSSPSSLYLLDLLRRITATAILSSAYRIVIAHARHLSFTGEVQPFMRSRLAEWLLSVCDEYGCDSSVFSICMTYVRYFPVVVATAMLCVGGGGGC